MTGGKKWLQELFLLIYHKYKQVKMCLYIQMLY